MMFAIREDELMEEHYFFLPLGRIISGDITFPVFDTVDWEDFRGFAFGARTVMPLVNPAILPPT
jgi:hypothetical protein